MTREEIIDFCEMKSKAEPENEDIFNYIIEVLRQEPCEDAISREAALMCMTGKYIADLEYKPEDIISQHIKRLKMLHSVTPTKKWILTSERQPKENGNYLALYRTSDGTYNFEFMMVDHCNAGGGWLHEENGRKAYKKVIAWMPLPDQYSEVEE